MHINYYGKYNNTQIVIYAQPLCKQSVIKSVIDRKLQMVMKVLVFVFLLCYCFSYSQSGTVLNKEKKIKTVTEKVFAANKSEGKVEKLGVLYKTETVDYNEKGEVVVKTISQAGTDIVDSMVYRSGRKTDLFRLNGQGKYVSHWEYEYNKKGELSKINHYSWSGKLATDELDESQLKTHFDSDQVKLEDSVLMVIYGANGKVVARKNLQVFMDNEKETVVEFDSLNNPIKVNVLLNGVVVSEKSYMYEYDKLGNWIVKVFLDNGQAVSWSERTISYF